MVLKRCGSLTGRDQRRQLGLPGCAGRGLHLTIGALRIFDLRAMFLPVGMRLAQGHRRPSHSAHFDAYGRRSPGVSADGLSLTIRVDWSQRVPRIGVGIVLARWVIVRDLAGSHLPAR